MGQPHPDVWAVVVAAGSGTRFGGPKQFADLGGSTVVERAVAATRAVARTVVVVLPAHEVGEGPRFGADLAVAGGPSRSASVRRGLEALGDDARLVVVHDAARPLAGPRLFEAVVEAVRAGASGALCALAVTDTLKELDRPLDASGAEVVRTVGRERLAAVQTPQAFLVEVLRRAHADRPEATDDAALVEALPASVRAVPGDPANLKLTTEEDLAFAEFLLTS